MKRHWFEISISCIVFLSIALRFIGLGSSPGSLYWDEIAMLVDSQAIAVTGNDFHGLNGFSPILPSYGDYKLPMYVWLSLPMMRLPFTPEVQIRLISALAGVATVILAGLIAYELTPHESVRFRRISTLCALFIVTILPWSIIFSHAAFEGHLGQVWICLSVYLILKARSHHWLAAVAGIIGVMGIGTYYSVRFVWPVVAISTWVYATTLQKNSTSAWLRGWCISGMLMLAIFGIGWFGMTKAPWYSESQQFRLGSDSVLTESPYVLTQNSYREATNGTPLDRIFSHRRLLQLHDVIDNASHLISPNYLFLTGDPNWRHGTRMHGLGYLAMLPLLIIGVIFLAKKHLSLLALLGVWWAVSLLPASIPNDVPHALRSLNALMPFSLIISYGLGYLFLSDVCRMYRLGIGYILVLLLSLSSFFYVYLFVYPTISAEYWQGGYAEVAKTIAEYQRINTENTIVYADIGDSRFFLWYLVYGLGDPQRYSQSNQKAFAIESIGSVYFSMPNTIPATLDGTSLILAGKTEAINDRLKDQLLPVAKRVEIQDKAQKKSFSVVLLTP